MTATSSPHRRTRAFGVFAVAAAITVAGACGDDAASPDDTPNDTPADVPAGEPGDTPPTDDAREAAVAADLFERVNDERRNRDLDPVEWDDQLAALAREWSEEMVDLGLQHRDIDASIFEDRLDGFIGVGENIFTVDGPLPAGHAHDGWMRSPGHRANILDPDWDRVGIGVHCTDDGSMYATQNFGRTADAGPGRRDPEREPPPEDPIARPETDGPAC